MGGGVAIIIAICGSKHLCIREANRRSVGSLVVICDAACVFFSHGGTLFCLFPHVTAVHCFPPLHSFHLGALHRFIFFVLCCFLLLLSNCVTCACVNVPSVSFVCVLGCGGWRPQHEIPLWMLCFGFVLSH